MTACSVQLVLMANIAGDVILACLGLLVAVIAAAIGLIILRKRFGPGSVLLGHEKFPLEILDDMYQKGMISEKEFKAMRRGLLGLAESDKTKKVDQDGSEPATMSDPLDTENPDGSNPESDNE